MPKFTRELGKPDISPSVQGGVVDTSAANAIQGFGEIGYKLASGAAVSELTGGAQSIDEIEADESLVTSGQEDIDSFVKEVGNLDSLGKIAAARKAGSISGTAANARAKVLLKKSLSDSGGMFAQEIKNAFGGFFNSAIDGGGFFKDEQDPYSKARASFEEEVWTFAMKHNMGFDQAMERITARNNRDLKLNQIEQTNQLDAGNVAFMTSSTAVNLNENFMSRMITALTESGEGALSQDQSRELKFGISQEINQARKGFNARFQKAGKRPTQKQIDDFNMAMKEVQASMDDILADNELQAVLKNRSETMSQTIDIENYKNHSNVVAVKRLYGDAGLTKLFDALSSKQVQSFYENNEAYKQMYDIMFPAGELNRKAGSAALSFLNPENEAPTRFEVDSATPLVAEPAVFTQSKDKLATLVKETPAAFVYFASDKWRAAIERGEYTFQDIENFMKKGIEKRKMDYMFENNALLSSISISQEVAGMRSIKEGVPESMRTVVTDQNGRSVGSKTYTAVLDALKVARKNPELWEGKYESPDDYVASLFSITKSTKDEGEPASPKTEGLTRP